ncbi:hypothetical protein FRB95_002577 [Tulasnella sp. JGI-2019a]|nr:hypothetical protein FRB95_002577 [Tulasnella sp. JGI-2019a]
MSKVNGCRCRHLASGVDGDTGLRLDVINLNDDEKSPTELILDVSPDDERPDDAKNDEEDIYRGSPPPSPLSRHGTFHSALTGGPFTPSNPNQLEFAIPAPSISSSSASSSSSSSSQTTATRGGRLGGLATLVERAVSRWARGRSTTSSTGDSSSSTSSSSSSSTSISSSGPRHNRRRRRRRGGSTAGHSSHAEELMSPTRLAWARQMREHSRRLPREFTLLLPSLPAPPQPPSVIRASSAKEILPQLETVLRRPRPPHRRRQHRDRNYRDPQMGVDTKGKGKAHASTRPSTRPLQTPSRRDHTSSSRPIDSQDETTDDGRGEAWWLDVASPTGEDMRALGKLLHLHPLTLEDILQQEPREKLELFPRLGYYFVVFRAIEAQYPSTFDKQAWSGPGEGIGVQGKAAETVIAVNMYLVVFKEGICSFHFENISEHADRMRNRIMQSHSHAQLSATAQSFRHITSDWIAHGLMDSVVDGFAPIIKGIEAEVDELEDLVSGLTAASESPAIAATAAAEVGLVGGRGGGAIEGLEVEKRRDGEDEEDRQRAVWSASTGRDPEKNVQGSLKEKDSGLGTGNVGGKMKGAGWWPRHWLSETSRRLSALSSIVTRVFRHHDKRHDDNSSTATLRSSTSRQPEQPRKTQGYYQDVLMRMAASRRLVTSLTRVLAPKNDVIVQIRKRLRAEGGLIWGGSGGGALELDIYLGDVQDHIVSMQQSLTHYERMMSEAQPEYLSQLRYSVSNSSRGIDKALLVMTSVTMSCYAAQVIIGVMSLNVYLPHNTKSATTGHHDPATDGPIGKFYGFGIVLCLAAGVAAALVATILWWLRQARKKFNRGWKTKLD